MVQKHFAQAKVTIKKQITIPKKVQKALNNVEEGDYILFYKDGNMIYVKKGAVNPV
ncbi:MAG: AbrB/MazE/SpoVT family DNA-binding domain-containing protein [Thermoplasmatales archaeon]|nr:AbrB/MazE/SpoVT family DNA-binding domain-containing protein [Thermoplasmatales archaeon]